MKLNSLVSKHKTPIKRKSIFFKYYLIFFLLFIFPVIVGGSILYINTAEKYKKEISSYNALLLKEASQIIDQKLSDIYEAIYTVSLNNSINEYLINNNKDKYYNLKQYYIWNELNTAQTNSDIIEDIVLYSLNDNTVVSSRGGTFEFGRFFEEIYCFEQMSKDDWLESLSKRQRLDTVKKLTLNHKSASINNYQYSSQKRFVIMLSSLPLNTDTKGGVIFFLNGDYFSNQINELNSCIDGKIMILNSRMEYIAGNDYDFYQENYSIIIDLNNNKREHSFCSTKIVDDSYLIDFQDMNSAGWKFIIFNDESAMYRNVNLILKIFLNIVFVFIIIGIITSFLLARHTYKPISSILEKIGIKKLNDENELDYINNIVTQILNEKNNLEVSAEENRSLVRQTIIKSLIEGRDSFSRSFEDKTLNYKFAYFKVVLCYLGCQTNTYMQQINEMINAKSLVIDVLVDSIYNFSVLVINFEKNEEFEEFLNKFCDHVKKIALSINEFYFVYTGNSYKYLRGIRDSYQEALKMSDMKTVSHKNVCEKFSDRQIKDKTIIYSIDGENALSGHVLAGDEKKVDEFLNNIFKNCVEKSITVVEMKYTMNSMFSTLYRCMNTAGTNSNEIFGEIIDINGLNKKMLFDFDGLVNDITVLFLSLTRYIKEQMNKRHQNIYESITGFVKGNYSSDIYMDMLTSEFSLSADYLRKIFKEFSGTTFVNYLNKIRVEKAKELILSSNDNVSEIGLKVGFNNINNYYKTFKRYTGMSPMKYKLQAKELDELRR